MKIDPMAFPRKSVFAVVLCASFFLGLGLSEMRHQEQALAEIDGVMAVAFDENRLLETAVAHGTEELSAWIFGEPLALTYGVVPNPAPRWKALHKKGAIPARYEKEVAAICSDKPKNAERCLMDLQVRLTELRIERTMFYLVALGTMWIGIKAILGTILFGLAFLYWRRREQA